MGLETFESQEDYKKRKPRLTPEQRQVIRQIVRSPGWDVVMTEILLPSIQQVSTQIDNIGGMAEDRRSVLRGIKYAQTHLIASLYQYAELPNPLELHYQAMLTTIRQFSGTDEPVDHSEESPIERQSQHRPNSRASFPV